MEYGTFTRITRLLSEGVQNYLIDSNYIDDIINVSKNTDDTVYINDVYFSEILNENLIPVPEGDTRKIYFYSIVSPNFTMSKNSLTTVNHKIVLLKTTNYGGNYGEHQIIVDKHLMAEISQYLIHHLTKINRYKSKIKYSLQDATETYTSSSVIHDWDNFRVDVEVGVASEESNELASNYFVRSVISSDVTLAIKY